MSLVGGFARCRIVRAKEAPLAMAKWWAKQKPAEAEITMHLAANEQSILIPWIKTFPKKAVDRFPTYLWPISTGLVIYATMEWAEYEDHHEDYQHRF